MEAGMPVTARNRRAGRGRRESSRKPLCWPRCPRQRPYQWWVGVSSRRCRGSRSPGGDGDPQRRHGWKAVASAAAQAGAPVALNEQAAAGLLPSRGDAFADRYARGLSLMDKSFPQRRPPLIRRHGRLTNPEAAAPGLCSTRPWSEAVRTHTPILEVIDRKRSVALISRTDLVRTVNRFVNCADNASTTARALSAAYGATPDSHHLITRTPEITTAPSVRQNSPTTAER